MAPSPARQNGFRELLRLFAGKESETKAKKEECDENDGAYKRTSVLRVYHDRESRRRPSHHVIRHHRPSKDSSIGTDADSIRNSKNLVSDSNCPPCPPCGSKRTSAASQDDTRQQSASGSVTKTSANDRERSLTKDDEECEEAIKMATKVCRKDCSAKEAGDVGSAATRPPKSSKRRRSESSDECKPKPRVEECLLSDDEEESTKAESDQKPRCTETGVGSGKASTVNVAAGTKKKRCSDVAAGSPRATEDACTEPQQQQEGAEAACVTDEVAKTSVAVETEEQLEYCEEEFILEECDGEWVDEEEQYTEKTVTFKEPVEVRNVSVGEEAPPRRNTSVQVEEECEEEQAAVYEEKETANILEDSARVDNETESELIDVEDTADESTDTEPTTKKKDCVPRPKKKKKKKPKKKCVKKSEESVVEVTEEPERVEPEEEEVLQGECTPEPEPVPEPEPEPEPPVEEEEEEKIMEEKVEAVEEIEETVEAEQEPEPQPEPEPEPAPEPEPIVEAPPPPELTDGEAQTDPVECKPIGEEEEDEPPMVVNEAVQEKPRTVEDGTSAIQKFKERLESRRSKRSSSSSSATIQVKKVAERSDSECPMPQFGRDVTYGQVCKVLTCALQLPCRNHLVLGFPAVQDVILYYEEFRSPGTFGVLQYKFCYATKKDETITSAFVLDVMCRETGGVPNRVSGGIGKDHVAVMVSSRWFHGLHNRFIVFGRVKGKSKPSSPAAAMQVEVDVSTDKSSLSSLSPVSAYSFALNQQPNHQN
jgi:hypothetical protein